MNKFSIGRMFIAN